jgi:hypothetical protein
MSSTKSVKGNPSEGDKDEVFTGGVRQLKNHSQLNNVCIIELPKRQVPGIKAGCLLRTDMYSTKGVLTFLLDRATDEPDKKTFRLRGISEFKARAFWAYKVPKTDKEINIETITADIGELFPEGSYHKLSMIWIKDPITVKTIKDNISGLEDGN